MRPPVVRVPSADVPLTSGCVPLTSGCVPFCVRLRPLTFTVPRSPFHVHRSAFTVPRSPFPVSRSTFIVPVHRSSFTVDETGNDERQRTLADASGRKRALVERIRTTVERRRMERGWNGNDGRTQKECVRVKNDIFTVYFFLHDRRQETT